MSSDPNLGLTDTEVVYELSSQFHSLILEIMGYGIYTTVYFVALYLTCMSSFLCLTSISLTTSLVSRGNRPRVGSAVLITVMWMLVTIHASFGWAYLDNIYIRHGETREAQLWALFSLQSTELSPLAVANSVVAIVSTLLADITMVITHSANLPTYQFTLDLAMLGAVRQKMAHCRFSGVLPHSSVRYAHWNSDLATTLRASLKSATFGDASCLDLPFW